MIEIIEQIPSIDKYVNLINEVYSEKRDKKIVKQALENSMYCVCAYKNDELIGFGRIVGDGGIFLHLHDVIVKPSYQGQGIGKKIINKILDEIEKFKIINPDIRVYLFSNKDKERFYEKFGFIKRPNDEFGAGMILKR